MIGSYYANVGRYAEAERTLNQRMHRRVPGLQQLHLVLEEHLRHLHAEVVTLGLRGHGGRRVVDACGGDGMIDELMLFLVHESQQLVPQCHGDLLQV